MHIFPVPRQFANNSQVSVRSAELDTTEDDDIKQHRSSVSQQQQHVDQLNEFEKQLQQDLLLRKSHVQKIQEDEQGKRCSFRNSISNK